MKAAKLSLLIVIGFVMWGFTAYALFAAFLP